MVEDFNMLFEYDSGYVVDGYKVPMGMSWEVLRNFSICIDNHRVNL